MEINIGVRVDSNPLYRKLRTAHKDMMARCYNINNSQYKNYGGRGVIVSEEWQTLNGFLKTAGYVEGWDEQQYLTTGLSLDKDMKGGEIYSVDTCVWMDIRENTALLSQNYPDIEAYSPDGTYYLVTNIDAFCREHSLQHQPLVAVASRKATHHKHWVFWYKGETPPTNRGWNIAISPSGEHVKFHKATELEYLGLNPKCVTRCLRGEREHHRQWRFILSVKA